MLYDAHNHLQDERLFARAEAIIAESRSAGLKRMVVNGSCESDWPQVLELAERYPEVLPSFGYHPWYVGECSPAWKESLVRNLDSHPEAVIGEIGLDRWIDNYDLPRQEEVFRFQMQLATERNLPASIHCLKAWGRLYDLLKQGPRPECGFLLHSYGGPQEMVKPLADLGAYFSFPGYFAHERKSRQRETFRQVPLGRLLVETDAPDQSLPRELVEFTLAEAPGNETNHPANIRAVYRFLAELLGMDFDPFSRRIEENFVRLFGGCEHPGK